MAPLPVDGRPRPAARSRLDILLACATRLYRARRFRESAANARRALRADPTCFQAYALIGWALVADVRRAPDRHAVLPHIESAARTCIRLAPDNATGHELLAWAHLFRNRFAAARDAAEQALRFNPDGQGALACLHEARRAHRRQQRARASVERSRRRHRTKRLGAVLVGVVALVAIGALAAPLGLPSGSEAADRRFANAIERFEQTERTIRSALVIEADIATSTVESLAVHAAALGSLAAELDGTRSAIASEIAGIADGRVAHYRSRVARADAAAADTDTRVVTATSDWEAEWHGARARWEATD